VCPNACKKLDEAEAKTIAKQAEIAQCFAEDDIGSPWEIHKSDPPIADETLPEKHRLGTRFCAVTLPEQQGIHQEMQWPDPLLSLPELAFQVSLYLTASTMHSFIQKHNTTCEALADACDSRDLSRNIRRRSNGRVPQNVVATLKMAKGKASRDTCARVAWLLLKARPTQGSDAK